MRSRRSAPSALAAASTLKMPARHALLPELDVAEYVSRENPAEDLRARARRFRDRCSGSKAWARRRCGRSRWLPSWFTAPRQHARSGAILVRAWRQGRHAVPGRSGDLRQDDRDSAQSDQSIRDRSVGEGERVQTAADVCRRHRDAATVRLRQTSGPAESAGPATRTSSRRVRHEHRGDEAVGRSQARRLLRRGEPPRRSATAAPAAGRARDPRASTTSPAAAALKAGDHVVEHLRGSEIPLACATAIVSIPAA